MADLNYNLFLDDRVNILPFDVGSNCAFVRGVLLNRQQTFGFMDSMTMPGSDISKVKSRYNLSQHSFNTICDMALAGDDDANDLLTDISSVINVTHGINLYVEAFILSPDTKPSILGYELLSLSNNNSGFYTDGVLNGKKVYGSSSDTNAHDDTLIDYVRMFFPDPSPPPRLRTFILYY